MTSISTPQNSTNVRSQKKRDGVPSWMRTSMNMLRSVSPEAAAIAFEHLFFRTQRSPAKPAEREVLRDAERFSVRMRDHTLAAWSWGAGDETIALIHGWNGRGSQLGSFVAPLVESGRRVVTFDHAGHGESTGSSSTILQMADAIATVSQAVGGFDAVIAHSFGAAAAVVAMSDGLPIERAVLIAPPAELDRWFKYWSRMFELDPRTEEIARERVQARVGRPFDAVHVPQLVRSLQQPALIVHDQDDREIPIAAGEAVHRAWPGARFLPTAGLGHTRILRSEGVIEAAKRFLT